MTENEVRSALQDYKAVWARVCGAAERTETAQTDTGEDDALLRSLLRRFSGARIRYMALAAQTGGAARQALLQLAAERRQSEKQLQLEYFILTGDSYALPPPEISPMALLSALRAALMEAWQDRAQCLAAAAQTGSESLRSLFGAMALQCERHGAALRTLLERALG